MDRSDPKVIASLPSKTAWSIDIYKQKFGGNQCRRMTHLHSGIFRTIHVKESVNKDRVDTALE